MAEVTAYVLAPVGSIDVGAGVAHLRGDGWALAGKMYELIMPEEHAVPLLGDQVTKAWESFTETGDREGVHGSILRNGVSVSVGTFARNGVLSIGLGWKPGAPPVPPDATDDGLLLPLAESVDAWVVAVLGTDPWWLPSLFRIEAGLLRLRLSTEQRDKLRDLPPERVYLHKTKEQHVDIGAFKQVQRCGAWLTCELVL